MSYSYFLIFLIDENKFENCPDKIKICCPNKIFSTAADTGIIFHTKNVAF